MIDTAEEFEIQWALQALKQRFPAFGVSIHKIINAERISYTACVNMHINGPFDTAQEALDYADKFSNQLRAAIRGVMENN